MLMNQKKKKHLLQPTMKNYPKFGKKFMVILETWFLAKLTMV